jgi:ARF7 effector protein C-terminus
MDVDFVDLLDSDEETTPPITDTPSENGRTTRSAHQNGNDHKQTGNAPSKTTTKSLRRLMEESKFLRNFDPEKSTREKRKLNRKNYSTAVVSKSNTMYDEKGRHRESGLNLCDCLDMSCPGCHFNCPNCTSTKCGPVCRSNRKWTYEQIEHDGKDLIVKNRLVIK